MTDSEFLNRVKATFQDQPPGSDAAFVKGCKCPRVDNAYGKGYLGGVRDEDGDLVFVVNADCPIHNPKP